MTDPTVDDVRRYCEEFLVIARKILAEELLRISTDHGTGSAGTGMFIHRIAAGGGLPYTDF
ncbi:hypothetical protein [Sorangium sp. So ce1389]|uniref:hypothetical protein n=1 Tax=Sorangium sp. So ce1389 TaxID=3133336 RepID=UPI003F5F8832